MMDSVSGNDFSSIKSKHLKLYSTTDCKGPSNKLTTSKFLNLYYAWWLQIQRNRPKRNQIKVLYLSREKWFDYFVKPKHLIFTWMFVTKLHMLPDPDKTEVSARIRWPIISSISPSLYLFLCIHLENMNDLII